MDQIESDLKYLIGKQQHEIIRLREDVNQLQVEKRALHEENVCKQQRILQVQSQVETLEKQVPDFQKYAKSIDDQRLQINKQAKVAREVLEQQQQVSLNKELELSANVEDLNTQLAVKEEQVHSLSRSLQSVKDQLQASMKEAGEVKKCLAEVSTEYQIQINQALRRITELESEKQQLDEILQQSYTKTWELDQSVQKLGEQNEYLQQQLNKHIEFPQCSQGNGKEMSNSEKVLYELKIEQLQDVIQLQKQQLDKYGDEKEELLAKVLQGENIIKEMNLEIQRFESVQKQALLHKDMLNDKDKVITEQKQHLARQIQQGKELNESICNIKQQLAEVRGQLHKSQQSEILMQTQILELSKVNNDKSNQINQQAILLQHEQEDIRGLNDKISELKKVLLQQKQIISDKDNSLSLLHGQIDALTGQISLLNDQNDENGRQIQLLEEHSRALESMAEEQARNHQVQITELSTRINELEDVAKQHETMKKEMQEKASQTSQYELKIKSYEVAQSQLKRNIENTTQLLRETQQQLQAKMAELTNEHNTLRTTQNILQQKESILEQYKGELLGAQERLDTVSKELHATQSTLRETQMADESKQRQINSLNEQIAEISRQKEETEQKMVEGRQCDESKINALKQELEALGRSNQRDNRETLVETQKSNAPPTAELQKLQRQVRAYEKEIQERDDEIADLKTRLKKSSGQPSISLYFKGSGSFLK